MKDVIVIPLYRSVQKSMASSQVSQASQLSSQDLSSLVNDTVIYILSKDYTKHPIKRQDIVKNVLKTHSRSYKQVMHEATLLLKKSFGMELLEVDSNMKQSQYILVNSQECLQDVDRFQYDDSEKAQLILLMVTLTLIYMNGGVMREEMLWNCLTTRLLVDEKFDEYFGEVRKLLTQVFVRQMYLEYIRLPEQDPPKYEFRWGKRAEAEGVRRHMLQFVCQMYKTSNMASWTTQYQEMLRSEGENMNEETGND